MQFRKSKTGRQIQVLAYQGYDQKKRRAKVKMLGAFDAYRPWVLTRELEAALTAEQRAEVDEHIAQLRAESDARWRQDAIVAAPGTIRRIANSLTEDGCDSKKADEIYRAMDELAKALRKQGHKRPAKPPKVKPDAAQVGLPLG